MDASLAALWWVAGFGAFWALVLGAVVALRLLADGAPPRARRGALGRASPATPRALSERPPFRATS